MQDGLRVVVRLVANDDGPGSAAEGDALQERIALPAGDFLDRSAGGFSQFGDVPALDGAGQVQVVGGRLHEGGVFLRLQTAKLMIQVGHVKLELEPRLTV